MPHMRKSSSVLSPRNFSHSHISHAKDFEATNNVYRTHFFIGRSIKLVIMKGIKALCEKKLYGKIKLGPKKTNTILTRILI